LHVHGGCAHFFVAGIGHLLTSVFARDIPLQNQLIVATVLLSSDIWTEEPDVRRSLAGLICAVAVASVADRVVSGRGLDAADSSTVLARGAYLVDDVALCGTCHTPRDDQNNPEARRPLSGGPVPFRPARPVGEWADVAPRLAGLPPGKDEEIVRLLMTGVSRTGRPPRPPMPQFRFTRSDAEAVLAYLKSLPTSY
jgi:mono/diheme cytochrome c family protein